MNACTIIARNYLAQARVLADSFLAHHPARKLTALVLDPPSPGGEPEPFEILTPAEIGLAPAEYRRMAAIYDVMQFATAVKPWLMRTMLERTGGPVFYFDPDIEIFAPLDRLVPVAEQHTIVLTPHRTRPEPYAAEDIAESALRLAGAYNLGFLGLGPDADAFLDWWSARLARDCVVAPSRGIFVDQRWFDFVPGHFEHALAAEPTLNVAWWNLAQRDFRAAGIGWSVDGAPLEFFHYSGYDPRVPHVFSKYQGPEPEILLSERPDLAELCARYARKLRERGFASTAALPYGLDTLPNGLRFDARARRLYRAALLEAERDSAEEPPNPYEDPGGFLDWLRESDDPVGMGRFVSRYLRALYNERADLRERFFDLRWLAGSQYLDWILSTGRHEEAIPFELMPEAEHAVPAADEEAAAALEPGLNVVGYFRAEAGVGEAARQILSAVEAAGVPHAVATYEATVSRQEHDGPREGAFTARYDTNLVCINADQLPAFTYDSGPAFFRDHTTIGVWWWEVAEFPERFHDAFELVDEIWVGSAHVARAISAETEIPVHVFPLPVVVPDPPPLDRAALGLPDGYLFLFSFDFLSVVERKNPAAVIEAFTSAFAPGEGPVLVVKSINGDRKLLELERLRSLAAGRPDVKIVDRYLSAAEKNALMAGADCYVSLHRSEGFGLTLAESMAYGRPVIATGYSGNLDFMTEENSYLVPYRLTEIPSGADPYPEGGTWAEPDLERAAALMRQVYAAPEEARERGERGRRDVERRTAQRAGEFVRERLAELRVADDGADAPPVEDAPARKRSHELERARGFLERGPTVPIRGESRFGAAGVLARRALFRALRPYMYRQREWEVAVVNALQEIEDTGLDATDSARSAAVAAREGELRALAQNEQTAARLARLEQHTRTWAETAERAGVEAAEARRQLEQLDGQLYAKPYLAEPETAILLDADGRAAIGYDAPADPSQDGVYRGFEDVFRGSESFVRDRQRAYVDLLREHAPVLDVGCGRGELLDALEEAGVEAKGIDADAGMVARSAAKGHDVAQADAIDHLEAVPDASLGAVTALHVIEHLSYEDLLRLLELVRAKLGPGGLFVAETVNPHALDAFKAFWVDPTHRAPIFPEVAVTLCRLSGFESARVIFPQGDGDLERDRRQQGEYAVLAKRG